jgi:hypothetical protein
VTRGEKNTAKAVTEFLVEVADVCGASGSWHESILGDM